MIAAAALLAGCRATILAPTEADDSRREVRELRDETDRLAARIAALEVERDVLRRGVDTPAAAAMAGVLPVPVRLELGRLSGAVWADEQSNATLARLYVRPLDGHGRFVHPLGDLTIELVAWPDSATPQAVASRRIPLADLVAMHRSGPTGTHYTVECALDPPLDAGASLLVRLRLEDVLTGRVSETERILGARSPRAAVR